LHDLNHDEPPTSKEKIRFSQEAAQFIENFKIMDKEIKALSMHVKQSMNEEVKSMVKAVMERVKLTEFEERL
jgi:hypothetical protein